jgi:exodeoxyribonuclease VII small subunit
MRPPSEPTMSEPADPSAPARPRADDAAGATLPAGRPATLSSGGSADPGSTAPLKFEEALAEVEQMVEQLESGELSLEDALDRYERGVRRLAECRKMLDRAQAKVEILRKAAGGEAVREPFEPGTREQGTASGE